MRFRSSLILATTVILAAGCSSTAPTATPTLAATATASPAATATPTTVPTPTSTVTVPPPTQSESVPPTATPTTALPPTVSIASTELGDILVDVEGRTLYIFRPDVGAPTCYGACAESWPGSIVDGEVRVGEGLDAALFTLVERTDGAGMQLSVDSQPLYTLAGTAAGDISGQGTNNQWFVVGPDGSPIH